MACIFPNCKNNEVKGEFCLQHGKLFGSVVKKVKAGKIKTKKELTLPELITKAQTVFNKWIRNRDQDLTCITCGRYKIEHACHFYPAGKVTALRFNEDNVAGGCRQCNFYGHGELALFRLKLKQRIGEERLAELDRIALEQKTKKYEREELEELIKKYGIKKSKERSAA
jgi:hypothetical protein